jgi:hypothetical protein
LVGGLTALAFSTSHRWLALVVPLAWFGVLVLTSLLVAVSIGPLPC